MHIIICDDNKLHVRMLEDKLFRYFKKHEMEIVIETFYSAQNFLDNAGQSDIVFMDIELQSKNGLEVIKKYRQKYDSLNILVTSHPEFVTDGYKIKAFRYLCKPVDDLKLEEALTSAIKEIRMKKRFIVEENKNKIIIFENEIIYIEAGDKYIGIRTRKGFFRMKGTINEIKKELDPVDFIIPHRTYVVNMNYVRTFNDKFLFLENGEKIKISRLKKNEVKEKFYSFIRGKTNDKRV